ncbi:HigA family addiction module antitoxin [Thalassotalea sp. 1_MG-2023]|uniref:HigA family addiction module antitoxin n=1 Tax=Thalassotalea sp. 1_MG-2023 TaxID=3062680 RepID=UPI0026E3DEB0|nr:HigA family addiction module antitoxin [Thalassotalea sp. 1_MG-2023]MDO6428905.1 HigA family addiction module antitoxin [Thalassotalea sp. 1_MG-2023]
MTIPAFVTQLTSTARAESLHRPHPGEVLKRRFLDKTELKRPEVAEMIGISTKHLSRLINGHIHVEVNLARKLEACTNLSARAWLHYQNQYDLYTTTKLSNKSKLLPD